MTQAALAALPAFADALDSLVEGSKGQYAIVTESSGYAVRVQLAGEDSAGPEWIATIETAVPAGTPGALLPLRGQRYLFIPTGARQSIVPFVDSSGSAAVSSTTLDSPVTVLTITKNLSAGVWTMAGTFSCLLRRSVDTGGMRMTSVIHTESPQPWTFNSGQATPLLEYRNIARSRTVEITLTQATDVSVSLGFTGMTTAGTTTCFLPGIDLLAIKKG